MIGFIYNDHSKIKIKLHFKRVCSKFKLLFTNQIFFIGGLASRIHHQDRGHECRQNLLHRLRNSHECYTSEHQVKIKFLNVLFVLKSTTFCRSKKFLKTFVKNFISIIFTNLYLKNVTDTFLLLNKNDCFYFDRFLHEKFSKLPAQAVEARLAGLLPLKGSRHDPRAASKEFLKIVNNSQSIDAQVMGIKKDLVNVNVLNAITIQKV